MAGGDARKSDLTVRVASAMVIVAVSGLAFWIGGVVLTSFVALIAAGMLWEWFLLSSKITQNGVWRWVMFGLGAAYLLVAAWVLWRMTVPHEQLADRLSIAVPLIGGVVATDVGAYFSGRLVGGPKIAPRISPNKTWAGLIGGMVLCAIWFANAIWYFDDDWSPNFFWIFMTQGALIAVVAQAGDFLESGLKRRAGVKDSGALIPGHGGLLDRLDGLVAVLFIVGVTSLVG